MKTIYSLKEVKKDYYLNKIVVPALRGIDFEIYEKECLAFVGPSGSGKSTLLHILGTVDSPTEGRVLFDGVDVSTLNDTQLSDIRAKKIGFIFQNFNLIPVLNVFENVEYPLRIRNLSLTKEAKEKIFKLIEDVGLKDFYKRKPNELSGGQRQRVAIARALVNEPVVILADEPTANLDSKTGDMILELIKDLSLRHNSTVVFSTHDQKIMNFVEKRVVISDGLIVDVVNK
ncbi:MAG TPA: ABC transporter ATP-binding protein [Spirochaetota bacterium]|nr:ABC transporter ATP-binding protein [Spirochaetota bacterium]